MKKTSLIPQFAITPYLSPEYNEPLYCSRDPIKATSGSLFLGLQEKDFNEFKQNLHKIDQYLPDMLKLQSRHLPVKKIVSQYQHSLPFFLKDLIDGNVHLYSLCPVPSFNDIQIEVLIGQCIDFQTPPDRSAWAIHFFCKKQNISVKSLTDTFLRMFNNLRNDKKETGQTAYYTKLAYSLYIRNLLEHMEVIKFLINNVGPLELSIFKSEISSTYCLLEEVFKSKNAKDSLNLFSDSLQNFGSALVQLGYLNNDKMVSSLMDDIKTYQTDQRAHVISEIIQAERLDYFTHFRNLIFNLYDLLDPRLISSEMSHYLIDANEEDIRCFLLNICDVLNWFPQKNNSLSAVIAFLMNDFLPKDEGKIYFIYDFFSMIFQQADNIHVYSNLFGEMQYLSIFQYNDFLRFIRKKGYACNSNMKTLKIVLGLPSYDLTTKTLLKINRLLEQLVPDLDYNSKLELIAKNIKENLYLAKDLDYLFKFQISLYLIENAKSFSEVISQLEELDTLHLIPNLIKKIQPSHLSISDLSILENNISFFISHNQLPMLCETLIKYGDLNILHPLYKQCEKYNQQTILSKYKNLFSEKKKETKISLDISKEKIQKLFIDHSYLCSLHVYDSVFNIKTEQDIQFVLNQFLFDLFSFEHLSSKLLFNFFVNFCDSKCVSEPRYYLMKSISQTIINNPQLLENEQTKSVIIDFLVKIFNHRFISPSYIISSNIKKQNMENQDFIFNLFFKILKDNSEFLSVNDILTEPLLKNINNLNHKKELLEILRQYRQPIITNSVLSIISQPKGAIISAAYFSLLPNELLNYDFNVVFSYFAKNVQMITSTFWTIWIKNYIYYIPNFPVEVSTAVKSTTIANHQLSIIRLFYDLILKQTDPSDPIISTYLNCWALLCSDQSISNIFVKNILLNDLNENISCFSHLFVNFIHPCLMNITETMFEAFCETLCHYQPKEEEFDQFAETSTSIFLVFIHKFFTGQYQIISIIILIADKLLSMLYKGYQEEKNIDLFLIIDTFNFIISKTNSFSKIPDSIEKFHSHQLYSSYERLHPELKKLILLNLTPQKLKTSDTDSKPLFYDVVQFIDSSIMTEGSHDFDSQVNYDINMPEIDGSQFQDDMYDILDW